MPKKDKKKIMKKKRMRGNKKVKKSNKQTTVINDFIVTEKTLVKLRYVDVDTPSINTGLNSYNFAFYKLNSMYDFNANILTSSIPGYGEWAQFYQYYKVRAVKYRIKLVNQTATPVHVVVFPTINVSAFGASWANFYKQMGNPNTRNVLLGGLNGNNTGYISGYIKLENLFGKKETYDAESNYQGAVGGNPANLIYLYVACLGQDATTTANTVVAQPEFTIYTELYGRNNFIA